jgi:type III secretion protein U
MQHVEEVLQTATQADADPLVRARMLLSPLATGSAIVAVFMVLIAVLASALQVGGVMSFSRIKPDASHLNPVQGLKRMFSWNTVVELLRLLLKLIALLLILWLLARLQLPWLAQAQRMSVPAWLWLGGQQFQAMLALCCLVFGGVSLADLAYQRWDYLRRLRMSKEDVRREWKEREGDPILRGRRKQLHHEISFNDMLHQVRKASVVVVNPTHVAVALHYDPQETPLPMVVAKGEGEVARAIREAALEAGVPIYRDITLARQLQAGTPLGDYIPDELLEAVAHVLRWVQSMQQQAQQQAQTGREGPNT